MLRCGHMEFIIFDVILAIVFHLIFDIGFGLGVDW